jgi:hypothetical protein
MMRWFVAATVAALCSLPASAFAIDCPPGAYPWVSARGLEYCKRDIYGPQEPAAQPSAESCPAGTRIVTNRSGERVCRRLRSSAR